jgi:hypothetical protein
MYMNNFISHSMLEKDWHARRHALLHRCLDELLADFILNNPDKMLGETSLLTLLEWSALQVDHPTPASSDT